MSRSGSPTVEARGRGRRPAHAWFVLLAVLVLAILAAFTGTAAAQTFSDVLPTHAYYTAIEGIRAAHVIDGYPQGDGSVLFKPGNPIWRAQFAKIIVGAMELPVNESLTSPFNDLGTDDVNTLYPHEHVAAAFSAGITTGSTATTFAPYVNIKRTQVVTMIVRAVKNLMPAGTLQTPPAGYHSVFGVFDGTHSPNMDVAEFNGLLDGLSGYGATWDPYADATRGEVAQIMWNVLNPPGPKEPIMPAVADLEPAVAHYDLSLTFEGLLGASGAPGDDVPIDETTVVAEATVEILGVTNGVADFEITVEGIRIDGQPAGIDPITVAFGLNGLGMITYMEIDGEPLPPDEMLRMTAITTFMFGSFLAPLQASLTDVGDEWTGSSDYSVLVGDGEISSDTWVRLQDISDQGGRRVATVLYTNDLSVDVTSEFDLADLMAELPGFSAVPASTTLTFTLAGTASEEGTLKIDTETGLPVYADADVNLSFDADITDIPAELQDMLGGLLEMGTLSLDITGSATLEETP